MGNHVTRRAFIGRPFAATTVKDKTTPGKDPFFDKYANKELPFLSNRTMSDLSPFSETLGQAEIMHLLRRITFGVNAWHVTTLTGMNVSDAVDLLIDNFQMPFTTPENCYQNTYPDTIGVPYGESWVWFSAPDNLDNNLNLERVNASFKPWWVGQMVEQQMHIFEKMTLFWSNHFGAQTVNFCNAKPIWQHYNTIRTYALGNFRTLVRTITSDPHMLMCLNGDLNAASAPDENYARELQELFTVGKGINPAYTEEDVRQAAKILTGWRWQRDPDGFYSSYFDDTQHDTTDKQFSSFYNNRVIKGRTGYDGNFETDDLIDMILANDEPAKYICRCLYRWFIYYVIDDNAEANVITPLAQIFRDSNYEIIPVLKALFKSEHFFDPVNRGCIIKSPVDLYVGFAREFNLLAPLNPPEVRYAYWGNLKTRCDELGQNLADPPNVAGWPAYYQEPVYYQTWINSDTIQKRTTTMSHYANDSGFPLRDNFGYVKIDTISFSNSCPAPGDPNQLVAFFSKYLLPLPVSTDVTNNMKAVLTNVTDGSSNYAADHYWTDAWNNYIINSTDPILTGIVRSRLDRLANYIISLEEYQLY